MILSCGETTTRIPDSSLVTGHGGPSQELVAGFALAASQAKGACMLSIDSEGTDGTTPAAGGITDSQSRALAAERGVDLHAALRGHATFEALARMGMRSTLGTRVPTCAISTSCTPRRGDGGRAFQEESWPRPPSNPFGPGR